MGVVYRAFDPGLQREVALKVLLARGRSPHPQDGVRWRRFRLEAEALARLDHPHVVRVHEVGEEDGVAFIVMALVEGQSLERLVADHGPLPPGEAARVAHALAGALEALHREGILHRDVKPANVVVTPEGRPVLMDFGLARIADASVEHLTATGQFVGTPSYMPPEQAAGRADVDPRADIYSLGATLFELLTGRPPCTGETLVEVLHAIQHGPAPRPSSLHPGIGPELDAICQRCLAKAPASRYACAGDLARDLAAFLANRPLEVARPSLARRTATWPRRRPWSAAALGLAGALLLALLADGPGRTLDSPRGADAMPAPPLRASPRARPGMAPRAGPPATPDPAAPSSEPPPAAVPPVTQRALEIARSKAAEHAERGADEARDDAIEQFEFVLRALGAREHPLRATVHGELAPLLAARATSLAYSEPERAAADATRALELVPGVPIDGSVLESFRMLATRAYARGERALSRSLLDRAISAGVSDGAHHDRGTLSLEEDDLEAAFTDYARAVELNPGRVVVYEREGLLGDGTHVQIARRLLEQGRGPGAGEPPLSERERLALQGFLEALERARALMR